MRALRLRAATEDDLAFSYTVTEDAMRDYVETTWGVWNSEQQREHHRLSFRPATHQVICLGDEPVGILAIENHATYVQLDKLYLLRDARNQGLGSRLISDVIKQAGAVRKPIRLRVLRVNTSAQRFYARHGFAVTSLSNERCFMERDTSLATRPDLTSHAAGPADVPFLTHCFLRSMEASITACRGHWDESHEGAQFQSQLDLQSTRVIQENGVDVGFLMVVRQPSAFELHTLCIAPERQGHGVGSHVTREVITQGVRAGCDVILSVLKVNGRAEALYRRLGFVAMGNTEHHRRMKYEVRRTE
jgi:ribosomal protein S18 acetylase RimI-like enzyme